MGRDMKNKVFKDMEKAAHDRGRPSFMKDKEYKELQKAKPKPVRLPEFDHKFDWEFRLPPEPSGYFGTDMSVEDMMKMIDMFRNSMPKPPEPVTSRRGYPMPSRSDDSRFEFKLLRDTSLPDRWRMFVKDIHNNKVFQSDIDARTQEEAEQFAKEHGFKMLIEQAMEEAVDDGLDWNFSIQDMAIEQEPTEYRFDSTFPRTTAERRFRVTFIASSKIGTKRFGLAWPAHRPIWVDDKPYVIAGYNREGQQLIFRVEGTTNSIEVDTMEFLEEWADKIDPQWRRHLL